MNAITDVLGKNPLLLLFVVAGIGYLLGRITIRSVSLGVAAVLFVGLGFGALDSTLRVPDVVVQLGLLLFVYTVGLSSGLDFVNTLRARGARDVLLTAGMLTLAATIAGLAALALGLPGPLAAGLYTGSLTNTPALAGVIEAIGLRAATASAAEGARSQAVVGYSVAYPIGVLTMLAVTVVARRAVGVGGERGRVVESARLKEYGIYTDALHVQTVRVTRFTGEGESIALIGAQHGLNVIFGRVKRGDHVALATGSTILRSGDLVSVTGDDEQIRRAAAVLGEPASERLDLDRSEFDARRVFVSNPQVAGRNLRELRLMLSFGALVTRVRRGDLDLLPRGDTVLQLGDRVRVVALRDDLDRVSEHLGDSYRHVSEIDVLAFGLGIALGLLLGLIAIPLPGGASFKLGVAGGPLVVGLVLGATQRTGPIVWTIPYSASQTLRQLGLVLFLAGIGVNSGFAFFSTVAQGGALPSMAVALAIAALTGAAALAVMHRAMRLPFAVALGMLAGVQTQPAVLSFAIDQSKNDAPNTGYAAAFPVAMLAKILLAQLLLAMVP